MTGRKFKAMEVILALNNLRSYVIRTFKPPLKSDRKLLEAVADIAYIAGEKKYHSGNSRADISDFIYWAEQFEQLHKQTDWNDKDYMTLIDEFARNKIKAYSSK